MDDDATRMMMMMSMTTARGLLKLPAFCQAMASRVSPRMSMWSMLMLVMTDTSGRAMKLVESYRPPMPTCPRDDVIIIIIIIIIIIDQDVHADAGDDGHFRARDEVGRVVPTADAHLPAC
jgi:hypothetical protein